MSDSLFFRFFSQPSALAILDYLMDNYGSPVSLEDISSSTCIPQSTVLSVLSLFQSLLMVQSPPSHPNFYSLCPGNAIVEAAFDLDDALDLFGLPLSAEAFDFDA